MRTSRATHHVSWRDLQIFALVKVHAGVGELPGRQHVEDLSDVRLGALDELIDHVRRNLHLLPRRIALASLATVSSEEEDVLVRDGHKS